MRNINMLGYFENKKLSLTFKNSKIQRKKLKLKKVGILFFFWENKNRYLVLFSKKEKVIWVYKISLSTGHVLLSPHSLWPRVQSYPYGICLEIYVNSPCSPSTIKPNSSQFLRYYTAHCRSIYQNRSEHSQFRYKQEDGFEGINLFFQLF